MGGAKDQGLIEEYEPIDRSLYVALIRRNESMG